jgi:GTP-binding protein EngB required for normal cell division
MNTRDGFNARKEAFATAITQLAEFFVRRGQQDLLVRASDLSDKLVAEQFNLVVLGQFKRGKSTLINALLGADLLPTAVVPLTSIVTLIHYGPAPRALVSFLDGRQLEVDVADIAAFITESQNPRNIKRVAQVTVAFPSDVLMDGVRLVDTPGVGSVFAGNTGSTIDYLPQADAAIFLLAADQPISQAELEFLHTVRQHAAKFFFILNKIDYLSERELKESMEFSAGVISEALASEVVIHPLSARSALMARRDSDEARLEESRLPAFEQMLTEFLMRDKGTTLLASMHQKLRALALETLNTIDLELSATRMPASMLAERIEAFHQHASAILQEQRDTEYLLRGEASALLSRVEADLRRFVDDHVEAFTQHMSEVFERHQDLSTGKLIEAMHTETARTVQEMFIPWRAGEESYVRETFERITGRFVERANRIIADIRRLSADLFEAQITPIIEVEPFKTESSHYYYIEDLFMLQLSRLPLLLPKALRQWYIRRQFLGSCREQLDLNAGRLRADFQERLQRSAAAFSHSFNDKVKATFTGLADALRRAADAKQRSDLTLETVQTRLSADRAAIVEILAVADASSMPC